ncbi:MAG: methylmalonyl-CoA mutase [Chloroflexi bacterium]|nr:methylmalonyl-CoA mutase [Chloroflexota bacterium]
MQRWQERAAQRPVRAVRTGSGIPVNLLYTPEDVASLDHDRDLGYPGEYPYTRGIYPSMFRSNLWTMRQYAGFGTAEDTNALFRRLLAEGNTGLSVAFDLPTQCGLDSDNPEAIEEVGRVGVAVASLADMEVLFDGIPLDQVSTSFTINATANAILAMYLTVAERQGVPADRVAGTIQNDILKEFMARGTWIYPVEPSLRLAVDAIEYCSRHATRFNPVSISSYHISEAGASELDSVGLAFANGIAYIEGALARGLPVDAFAPRLSFNLSMNRLDFFEEVAKLRGGRRLWARLLRDRFGAKDPRSWMLRLYAGCGGIEMTRAEPMNNAIRVAYMMLAMALTGPQAMHACSYDEAYEIPSPSAQLLATRTQQILAFETGITNTIDPLGGAYFVEALTNRAEQHIRSVLDEIDALGGVLRAIDTGWVQQRLAAAAYDEERRVQTGEKVVVGVNRFQNVAGAAERIDLYEPDQGIARRQIERLRETRRRRDEASVRAALDELRAAAATGTNTMPATIAAVKTYATVGEITATLRSELGAYREPVVV